MKRVFGFVWVLIFVVVSSNCFADSAIEVLKNSAFDDSGVTVDEVFGMVFKSAQWRQGNVNDAGSVVVKLFGDIVDPDSGDSVYGSVTFLVDSLDGSWQVIELSNGRGIDRRVINNQSEIKDELLALRQMYREFFSK